MLTEERHAVLTAVSRGEVTARRLPAVGSPLAFTPREYTVALGYLQKARLVEVETTKRTSGKGLTVTVLLTEAGTHALSVLPT
jgi:hypothetical protein